MDVALKDRFIDLWRKYFNNAPLPLAFYYTELPDSSPIAPKGTLPRCLVAALAGVRKGKDLSLEVDSIGCPGGKRYCGFSDSITADFDYFLSYGIPGRVRGERYVKSPDLVKQVMAQMPPFRGPSNHIVFKRWDRLEAAENPDVVCFFPAPDVLAGLFTLARFDNPAPDAVIVPFGSGCSTLIQHPYQEKNSSHPRAIIGMFDPSARPYVNADELSFSVPFPKFATMVDNMEESFLITESWQKIQRRI